MAIAGRHGKFYLINEPDTKVLITEMKNWSLDITSDPIDTSCFGTEWADSINGIMSWSGTSDAFFNVQNDTEGQAAIQAAFLAGTPVKMGFYIDENTGYEGTAIITSLNITDDVADAVTMAVGYTGRGALVFKKQ